MKDNPKTIGDILITFQKCKKGLPTRSINQWEVVSKFGKTQVWMTKPDENWRGFPLHPYKDKQWQIWVFGEFYGNQPKFPDALFKPESLNGHFIVFAYEYPLNLWHIITNRFGSVQAYYANDGKRRAVGTFSPAVAESASDKQLDLNALAGLFRFGFFLGEDTYWQDVQILPPASYIILDRDGQLISKENTWTWQHVPDPNITHKMALEGFTNVFESVVQDQVRGKSTALPISGGLDSRSTLIPLTRPTFKNAVHLFPFSYGYTKDSAETTIAGQLADKRNLDLRTWTIQPYLFDNIEWIISAVEGFQNITLCRQAYVVKNLAQSATHVMAAHWGDVWLDDMGFLDASLPDELLAKELVRKFTKRGNQVLLDLFRDVLPKDASDQINESIIENLHELSEIDDLDFKVKAWKTQNWSFRWTLASLRAYQIGLFPLLPFYDHRLADFFLSLPSSYLKDRKLQIDYIKRNAPDLARVPWQPYDANLFNYKYFDTWLLPKRAIKKVGRLLRRETVIERNWEVQFLNPKGHEGLRKWLLSPGLKLHNFIPKAPLEDSIQNFFSRPNPQNGYAVSMLLTFSAWLEQYG